ncbi:MAG: Rrf2 family transcriptional regulator [Planctomycetota bacterium]
MRISQKVEYAMRAMLELAVHASQEGVECTADIARSQRIPVKFLELILVELRRAGLVLSQRGAEGGHRLARDPERISVGDIWRAMDDSAAELAGNGRKTKAAGDPFRSVWVEVDNAVSNVVDQTTLADMKRRAETGRGTPDFNI